MMFHDTVENTWKPLLQKEQEDRRRLRDTELVEKQELRRNRGQKAMTKENTSVHLLLFFL